MKKLVILRGNIGSGKSTFIKEHNLEIYTLCTDTLRLMYNAPEMTLNHTEMIPQFNNQKVWNLLYEILEERMKKGEFTIIDALHAKYDDYSTYKKLADKYRYRTYIVDFSDVSLEELYKRNSEREDYKQVPEYAINRVNNDLNNEKIPSSFIVIKPEEFNKIIDFNPLDVSKYNKIHVIGDIHACINTLKEYIDKYNINDDELYIFTGDYFDKGLNNIDTFNLLNELSEKNNIIMLIGNHEEKIYKYAFNDEYINDYDIETTIKEIEGKIKKSELRGFIRKLSQCSYIEYNGIKYLITHGGIPFIPNKELTFYSSNTFIYGVGKYSEDIDKAYNDFMINQKDKIYQVHAHRNNNNIKYDEYKYSLNLDGNIENGGYLRVLDINKDNKLDIIEIKNNIFDPRLEHKEEVFNLINNLRKNKYIFEKELNNNISSFNFSKDAFYNKVWNNITTHARGLFIDTKNFFIVARSYNKFFNIDEVNETKIDNIRNNITYPVNFYLKYNGFLGLLSIHNNELYFVTKSSDEGICVEYFKNIFNKIYNKEQINNIKERLIKNNTTFVFEVIDHINDKHIIEYNEDNLILLDEIYNEVEYNKVDYEELKEFSINNNMTIKDKVYTCNNIDEFNKIYNEISNIEYKYNNNYVEGFVIEDNNKLMFKFKTEYYKKWKNIRTKMENCIKNNKFNIKSNDNLEIDFINYIKDKYSDKVININDINIIDERKSYLNNEKN